MSLADLDSVVARALGAWKPPEQLALSEWADRYYVLSAETAAEPGPWTTLPYQREILDSISDPDVTQVSLMKSSRIGYTLCMSAAMGYFMHHDPASMLVVQPTVEDAKNFGKETVAAMLRDVPVLSRIMLEDVRDGRKVGPRDSSNTLTHKAFPGGILSLVGANSGAGFRRVSRRVVMFDEVDAYPPSAGSDGDQIRLGMKRAEAFHNRKIIAGSTPLIAGISRIEKLFEDGDQRRYLVPCPQCDWGDFLVFREGDRGHFMAWPSGKPDQAHFVCRENGCVIEHRHKRRMVEAGTWRPDNPAVIDHRSYHIWTAYSYAPNATWAQIANEFLKAKAGGVEALKTFVNTTLGETWQDRGEAPDWERLYHRRETYPIGTVPAGVHFLTAGVDVQKDRFVFEVVGWGLDKQSWSIDASELYGDTADEKTWTQLDELLGTTFAGAGGELPIAMMAIDSGYNTQQVYNWARRYPMSRVIAVKGVATARTLIGTPSPVDVTARGKRMQRGYRVWPVGVDIAKSELYGWLRLPLPEEGEEPPPGYCHFPEHDAEYFRQLTAEHLVTHKKRNGFVKLEWQIIPGRENHILDARIYARAAAAVQGLDRVPRKSPGSKPKSKPPQRERASSAPAAAAPRRKSGGWIKGGRGGKGWLGRRR